MEKGVSTFWPATDSRREHRLRLPKDPAASLQDRSQFRADYYGRVR